MSDFSSADTSQAATKPVFRPANVGGSLTADFQQRSDGSWLIKSTEPLKSYPRRLTDRLEHWADEAPERTFVAQRDPKSGEWVRVTYAGMLSRAQAMASALVERKLSPERPVVILSENSLDHLTLAMGAMWAGVPYCSVSPAYSLLSSDFGKLRHILGRLTPGLVYVRDAAYQRAIDRVLDAGVEVVVGTGEIAGRSSMLFTKLLNATPSDGMRAAHDAVGPDTVAKFLFTSGSTKAPKGVINTQRMICANLQMKLQCFPFLTEAPPVLVDWLPWNHTFGGNHNIGLTLYNGGTLYIDDGKPTPQGIAETLRNLRELSPTVYFNVPSGLQEIAAAMERDDVLRESLFKNLRMIMFAGAGLAQEVWDRLDRLAEQTLGMRVPVFTGLGMTEASPTCTFSLRAGEVASGHIGLPVPGVELKLVPSDEKMEARFRGPNLTPGYHRDPELTAAAFDEEGFYKTGDAVRFLDPEAPGKGLFFDGRIAEDFKLSSGTFVSVGPLRARVIKSGDPCVQDSVATGINRDQLGLLVFPNAAGCRGIAGVGDDVGLVALLAHPKVNAAFQKLANDLWISGTGGSSRVARLMVLSHPPSIDLGEITDKGSINQRAVLIHRAGPIEQLYAARESTGLIFMPMKVR